MLYASQQQSNKEIAERLIRKLVGGCTTLAYALVLLEICKQLFISGAKGDPVYTFCICTLGLRVENLAIGQNSTHLGRRVISLGDISQYFEELATMLINGSNLNVSSNEVRGFAAFLKPLKLCAKDKLIDLHDTFFRLLQKTRHCLEVVKQSMDMTLNNGWDQYLIILKELHGIAKVYDGAEFQFWSDMKLLDVALRILIVTYARRGGDYGWVIEKKDILDFDTMRHLVLLMLPDVEAKQPFRMTIDRSEFLPRTFDYVLLGELENLRGGLDVIFEDEVARGPGVLREWFHLICTVIFFPDVGPFKACPENPRKIYPNPDYVSAAESLDVQLLDFFKFAGRIIALALTNSKQVDVMFDRTFFLQLANIDITLEDVKEADPQLYRSFKQILDMDPGLVDEDALGLSFVYECEEIEVRKSVELIPNGKDIIVNSGNMHEYVQLYVKHGFVTRVAQGVAKFVEGFAAIVGSEATQELIFKSLELEKYNSMLHGTEWIESFLCVQDWKAHTVYLGYKETDPQIVWFWEIVEGMTSDERKNLLYFWTAMVNLPVDGFRGLHSKLEIRQSNKSMDHLPISHTCFYRLVFPSYPSLAFMKQQLDVIIRHHVTGFGEL